MLHTCRSCQLAVCHRVSHFHVSRPRCSWPPRYLKPACATLAASLSMAHCVVQLNSYYYSALSLSLAHHSPISAPCPLASISPPVPGTSQVCGPREVNARTQQSASACKVSGRAVTLFKSVRVYASIFLHPARSLKIPPICETHT